MRTFKQWLAAQEATTNSGTLNSNPTATTAASQKVASAWTSDPKNASQTGQLVTTGMNHKSGLMTPLMNAASQAMKTGPLSFTAQTNAPLVAGAIQSSLNLPKTQVFQPPKPTQLAMMRKR